MLKHFDYIVMENQLLAFNPTDQQGIRAYAIKINFDLKRPEEVIKICEKFPEDGLADTTIASVAQEAFESLGSQDRSVRSLLRDSALGQPLLLFASWSAKTPV